MKPNTEMREGPEALQRFENAMKAIFSKRKADVMPDLALKADPPKSPTPKNN